MSDGSVASLTDYVFLKKLSYCTFLYTSGDKMYIIKKDKSSNNEHIKEIIVSAALNRGIDYIRELINNSDSDFIQSIGSIKKIKSCLHIRKPDILNESIKIIQSNDDINNNISSRVPDFIESFKQDDDINNNISSRVPDFIESF